ncbi:hypothetical protein GCM10028810_44400 [Spirosoma litoris]
MIGNQKSQPIQAKHNHLSNEQASFLAIVAQLQVVIYLQKSGFCQFKSCTGNGYDPIISHPDPSGPAALLTEFLYKHWIDNS